jgi:hypothetical protein
LVGCFFVGALRSNLVSSALRQLHTASSRCGEFGTYAPLFGDSTFLAIFLDQHPKITLCLAQQPSLFCAQCFGLVLSFRDGQLELRGASCRRSRRGRARGKVTASSPQRVQDIGIGLSSHGRVPEASCYVRQIRDPNGGTSRMTVGIEDAFSRACFCLRQRRSRTNLCGVDRGEPTPGYCKLDLGFVKIFGEHREPLIRGIDLCTQTSCLATFATKRIGGCTGARNCHEQDADECEARSKTGTA